MIAYAITDPITFNFNTIECDLRRFSLNSNIIVYRDKLNLNYAFFAKRFIEASKKYSFEKILLHTNYTLAHELKADGVHLKSTQFSDIIPAKSLGLFVVISTHTIEEAKKAERLGADMVTFSPIFQTPNKGKPKGVKALSNVASLLSIPVIALGGLITEEEINICLNNGAKGFASIRWFK